MFDDDKSALEQIYGRSVTQGELADFLGMPLLEFEKIFSRARGGVPELFSIQDVPVVSEQADQLVLRLEVLDHMRPAFARLTEQEQNVLAAVFYGGKSLAEVGTDFGLSKQRIGVIKNSALAKLRKKLPDFLRGTLCD
jgi:RNA polymerase sigma factor for flagellar operon FliA